MAYDDLNKEDRNANILLELLLDYLDNEHLNHCNVMVAHKEVCIGSNSDWISLNKKRDNRSVSHVVNLFDVDAFEVNDSFIYIYANNDNLLNEEDQRAVTKGDNVGG